MNESVFYQEIQDSQFPRKRGFCGIHLHEFGEKGVIFLCSVCYREKGGSFGLKSQRFTAKKGVHFGLKSQCFIMKKGLF